ncbi:MAG: nucleotidyltransferase domain-containing protein [Anaerolineae bacterium]
MVAEPVIRSVKLFLEKVSEQGIPVRCGVIFGSQVTDRADAWSDIDLLVVSPKFDGPRKRNDVNLLWRMAARTDSRIEPIPVGERQYQEDTSSAIIEVARREGVVISLTE